MTRPVAATDTAPLAEAAAEAVACAQDDASSDERLALFRRYPKRIDVPLMLIAAIGTLITGLSLPVMQIKKLIFWKDHYTIVVGAITLCKEGDYVLGVVLFTFSVIFPTIKLIGLSAVWFLPLKQKVRDEGVWWLGALGRWSMLDVFVVAVTVVLSKSKALGDVTPQIGLYVFGGSVVLSLIAAIMIDRVIKAERRRTESPSSQ